MKSYKEFNKQYIGSSDVAALILVGCGESGIITAPLNFGQDGSYLAYVVDKAAEIGKHYTKVFESEKRLNVYEDDGSIVVFKADKIIVYRAAEMGCIIQLIQE